MRALAAALLLAGPVAAEGGPEEALCRTIWSDLMAWSEGVAPLTGTVATDEPGACVLRDVRLDLAGEYVPDWHADRLRLRGGALDWMAGGSGLPDRLEVEVEGLRLVVETGSAQMDYLFAAQARAQTIFARAALRWDAAAKVLTVEAVDIDFPGENRVQLSAVVEGVDLSSAEAMQMSVAGFALRSVDLTVQTHGLFESYLLIPWGTSLLPPEGDMEAAVAALKAEAVAAVADLPGAAFSADSRAALGALIRELPNPAGRLTVAFRVRDGFGPARFPDYAATGAPGSLGDAAPLLDGVTIDIGWTHEEPR